MRAILGIVLLLSGCASSTSSFRSPDGKYTNVCSVSSFGLIHTMIANNEYHNCREAYIKAGYTEAP